MKKTKGLTLVSLAFVALLATNLVSAYYYFPSARFISQDLVNTVTDFFQPILTAIFGTYSYTYIFETFLIFIIIASLVYIAIGRVPIFEDQRTVRWILTIVIPLLSVRFIDYEWLITIFNSYQLLGIALTCILPFLLYFFFLYSAAGDHGIIRKAGWALWVAVYIGLWSSDNSSGITNMVYFWTFIVGLVCLFGDTVIYRRYKSIEEGRRDNEFMEMRAIEIGKEIKELTDALKNGLGDKRFIEHRIKELEKERKWLRRHR